MLCLENYEQTSRVLSRGQTIGGFQRPSGDIPTSMGFLESALLALDATRSRTFLTWMSCLGRTRFWSDHLGYGYGFGVEHTTPRTDTLLISIQNGLWGAIKQALNPELGKLAAILQLLARRCPASTNTAEVASTHVTRDMLMRMHTALVHNQMATGGCHYRSSSNPVTWLAGWLRSVVQAEPKFRTKRTESDNDSDKGQK